MAAETPESDEDIYRRFTRPERNGELDIFRRLTAAHRDGKIAIDIDRKTIGHPHCPVAGDAYFTRVLYAGMVIAGLAFWLVHYAIAVAIVAGMVALYFAALRRWIDRKTKGYVIDKITNDLALWKKLWNFGGVTLTAASASDATSCRAPKDNWKNFVTSQLGPTK
jgi:hypothetical protein